MFWIVDIDARISSFCRCAVGSFVKKFGAADDREQVVGPERHRHVADRVAGGLLLGRSSEVSSVFWLVEALG